ncbi:MAG: bifunctional 4-hydroxy-2-oxoglutarate aldolase/2-dehydro-3-deoxy-phosphogluconate aldolase [Culicoidibacterales bacterium]
MIEKLLREKIILVIRAESHTEAAIYVEIALRVGLKAIELTYSIPDVCDLIRKMVEKYPAALIGVGSVLDTNMATDAVNAGAQYVVGPGFVPEIGAYCNQVKIPYIPGVLTPTEILGARGQGHKLVKIFPGTECSTGYLKALQGPIPDVKFMVTGGVDLANMANWFTQGASVVGIGSVLNHYYENLQVERLEQVLQEFKEGVV